MNAKQLWDRIWDNGWTYGILLAVGAGAFLYLRNGPEYYAGKSGGMYWDNKLYCESNPDGRMKITRTLISCRAILTFREYCAGHPDESITIAGETIGCDRIMGRPRDDHSPLDSF